MSLTDDWKEGKIEDGFYYVKTTEIDEAAIVEAQCGDLLVDIPEMIVEVLAPVPSYEGLQALKEDVSYFQGIAIKDGNEHKRQVEEYNQTIRHYTEENINLKLKIKHLLDLQANQDKEVERLRDLLRKCKYYVSKEYEKGLSFRYRPYDQDLLTRINAAIGESEE